MFKKFKALYFGLDKRGGMHEIHSSIINRFKKMGFKVDKVSKTSIHLSKEYAHAGSVEFDIIQTDEYKAVFALESKPNTGTMVAKSIEVNYMRSNSNISNEIINDLILDYINHSEAFFGQENIPLIFAKDDGEIFLYYFFVEFSEEKPYALLKLNTAGDMIEYETAESAEELKSL